MTSLKKTTKTDYYCNQKFWWLSVDAQRKTMNSCCAAASSKIDTQWLSENPGELFNSPGLVQERMKMLDGQCVESCSDCWAAEANDKISRRTSMDGAKRTHVSVKSSPEVVNVILKNDCNLTCVYCCKQFSTAWLRDINEHGEYFDADPRFQITPEDRLLIKLSQPDITTSKHYNQILSEIKQYKPKRLSISGGEPMLNNGLVDLIKGFDCEVEIVTGLGVNNKRLKTILDNLPDNVVKFAVSAENKGALYEFNRYGNSWENFLKNLELISKYNYNFLNTLTNTTIHGFSEFKREFYTDNDFISFCNDPDFLSVNVMDDESKRLLSFEQQDIMETINSEYTSIQAMKAKKYIKEFSSRRNLNLAIFPESFQQWLTE